jgi:hypothetical protein
MAAVIPDLSALCCLAPAMRAGQKQQEAKAKVVRVKRS